MQLERLRLKNYKMFRDVDLCDLPALAVFVGVNGSGKTTLFDVFDFLRDSLDEGVEDALSGRSILNFGRRGGLREMRTRGEDGPIVVEMAFLAELGGKERRIEYLFHIGEGEDGDPRVEREILTCPLGDGPPIRVLDFANGKGTVVDNEAEYDAHGGELTKREESQDARLLAAASICQADRYMTAGVLRKFVEDWHLSNFQNAAARESVETGNHKHPGPLGRNLAGFVQFMQEKHKDNLADIMKKMSHRIPGFDWARAKQAEDGQIHLMFKDARWGEPFDAGAMSDGTLKMLGILSLLHAPEPRSLLCVEEPEREMYPHLLGELVEDFRRYARRSRGNVLVSTHSYELLNAADPEEVFLLEKNKGVTNIRPAGKDKEIRRLVDDEGDVMGRLWRMGRLLTEPEALQ